MSSLCSGRLQKVFFSPLISHGGRLDPCDPTNNSPRLKTGCPLRDIGDDWKNSVVKNNTIPSTDGGRCVSVLIWLHRHSWFLCAERKYANRLTNGRIVYLCLCRMMPREILFCREAFSELRLITRCPKAHSEITYVSKLPNYIHIRKKNILALQW